MLIINILFSYTSGCMLINYYRLFSNYSDYKENICSFAFWVISQSAIGRCVQSLGSRCSLSSLCRRWGEWKGGIFIIILGTFSVCRMVLLSLIGEAGSIKSPGDILWNLFRTFSLFCWYPVVSDSLWSSWSQ